MKKNGFTLVELLIVIVLIAVITTIGTAGVIAVKKNIEKNLWESTISLIEKAAIEYGEDRKNAFESNAGTCKIDGVDKNPCMKVSVKTLLEKNYISTKETIGTGDDEQKVLINNTKEKEEVGYYLGTDSFVSYALIYLENDVIYAKYIDGEVSISDEGTILGKENIKVSFRAINDTFLNNQNIVEVNIHISSDGKYYLTDRDIPAVKTDKNGSWDLEPVNNKIVTDGMTFTYTYEMVHYACSAGSNLVSCIKSKYISQGVNNLYHHDGTLVNGINDGSYRYAGGDYKVAESYKNNFSDIVRYVANPDKSPYDEDYYRFYLSYETNKYYESFKEAVNQAVADGYLVKEEIKNYVCFGTENAICDSDHLYRIIGVFGNQVKLIKAFAADETVLGTSSQEGLKNSWGSSSNIWSESKLNLEVLNGTYITNLTNKWSNKIASTDWKVGGNTFENIRYVVPSVAYQNEVVNPVADDNGNKTYNAKIGLIYTSDYAFAASPKSWTIEVGAYYNSANTNNNWMYLGEYEWTISRVSDYENNAFEVYYIGDVGMHYISFKYVIRPAFYLNSNITYKSGTGTETDPIRIN